MMIQIVIRCVECEKVLGTVTKDCIVGESMEEMFGLWTCNCGGSGHPELLSDYSYPELNVNILRAIED